MNHDMDDFLKSLKENTDAMIEEILGRSKLIINEIDEKSQSQIEILQNEQQSELRSRKLLESFQRELSSKHLEWVTRISNEEDQMIKDLFGKLRQRFLSLSEDAGVYDLLSKLYGEVRADIGSDFVVHITKNCSPEKFKGRTGVSQTVVADLNRVGIEIERKDIPVTIENTLETRMEKLEEDLKVLATKELWGDLDIAPWDAIQVLNRLIELST